MDTIELILDGLILIALIFLIIFVIKKRSNKDIIEEYEHIISVLIEVNNSLNSIFGATRNILNKLDQISNSEELKKLHRRIKKIEKKVGYKDED